MDTPDKKAMLDELRLDRDASGGGRRPLKWFVAFGVVAGLAFVAWAFGRPLLAAPALELKTVLARSQLQARASDSVLDATGYVVARRQATVSSKTTGKVLEVRIEEGMTVQQGQLLAVLDDAIPRAYLELGESQLRAAEASSAEARVAIEQAELDLDRTRNLAERNLASEADLDRDRLALAGHRARLARLERDVEVSARSLEVQRRQLADMEIRAPFGGVVIAKAAQPGEMISPVSAGGGFTRTGICTIVDMDSLEVEVDVNEAYINRVFPEQPATVNLNAYPELDLPAQVIATIPAADRSKATVRVRIGFLGRDPRILPDMGVKVAFLEDGAGAEGGARKAVERAASVRVPSTSVGEDREGHYVYVIEGGSEDQGGVAVRRSVGVGAAVGTETSITSGLAGGERVVAVLADAPDLADGDRVAVSL